MKFRVNSFNRIGVILRDAKNCDRQTDRRRRSDPYVSPSAKAGDTKSTGTQLTTAQNKQTYKGRKSGMYIDR